MENYDKYYDMLDKIAFDLKEELNNLLNDKDKSDSDYVILCREKCICNILDMLDAIYTIKPNLYDYCTRYKDRYNYARKFSKHIEATEKALANIISHNIATRDTKYGIDDDSISQIDPRAIAQIMNRSDSKDNNADKCCNGINDIIHWRNH